MIQKFKYIDHYKIDAEEFDYFEERSGATKHDERRVHEYIISKIKTTPQSILDVGSGSAWVAQKFDHTKVKIFSLDISKQNVETAKKISPGNNHFPLVADSLSLPFVSGSFDLIIASEVIEHVIDPEQFIKELLKAAVPGVKVIITTPYKEKLKYFLCIHCNKKTPVHAHIRSFDEDKLISYSSQKTEWNIFGNKLLIFLRTYVILQFLSFRLWKVVDDIFNLIFKKPVHLIVQYYK